MQLTILDTITGVLHSQNQFLTGGLVLGAMGTLVASLKSIPGKLFYWAKKQTTISITVTDDTGGFSNLQVWFNEQDYKKRLRRMDYVGLNHADGEYKGEGIDKFLFSPSPGNHWFFYKGRPLFISFSRKEDGVQARRRESFLVWTLGRDPVFIKNILADAFILDRKRSSGRSRLWITDNSANVDEVVGYVPRSLSSVVIEPQIKSTVLNDLISFKNSEKWYEDNGIPYHRGYLLHGLPGTGKTSLIVGLAKEMNSKVMVINVAVMTDQTLMESLRGMNGAFVILEDVDCASSKRTGTNDDNVNKDNEPKFGVTLSGLLNVLDGIATPHGIRFFLTTNHIEKLDPALIRPGRVDFRLEFGYATEWQKETLYLRLFPQETAAQAQVFSAANEKNVTMATYQSLLMHKRNQEL